MTKIRKVFRSGEKGFTLIELLVVISILGAIAAVVVLNVGQFMGRGKVQAACTELHNVQTAVIAYMVDNSTDPNGMDVNSLTPDFLLTEPTGSYNVGAGGVVTQNDYLGVTCNTTATGP